MCGRTPLGTSIIAIDIQRERERYVRRMGVSGLKGCHEVIEFFIDTGTVATDLSSPYAYLLENSVSVPLRGGD